MSAPSGVDDTDNFGSAFAAFGVAISPTGALAGLRCGKGTLWEGSLAGIGARPDGCGSGADATGVGGSGAVATGVGGSGLARHCASRLGAAGEFRARASRACSQSVMGGPVLPDDPPTRPRDFTGSGWARHCASRSGAAGEFRARASRARSQSDIGGPVLPDDPPTRPRDFPGSDGARWPTTGCETEPVPPAVVTEASDQGLQVECARVCDVHPCTLIR